MTRPVVELLLAAIRPWQLMAGQVLGIGLVGLLLVGIGVAGMPEGKLTGASRLSLSAGSASLPRRVVAADESARPGAGCRATPRLGCLATGRERPVRAISRREGHPPRQRSRRCGSRPR